MWLGPTQMATLIMAAEGAKLSWHTSVRAREWVEAEAYLHAVGLAFIAVRTTDRHSQPATVEVFSSAALPGWTGGRRLTAAELPQRLRTWLTLRTINDVIAARPARATPARTA